MTLSRVFAAALVACAATYTTAGLWGDEPGAPANQIIDHIIDGEQQFMAQMQEHLLLACRDGQT